LLKLETLPFWGAGGGGGGVENTPGTS